MFEILEKKVWLAEEPRIVEFLVKAPEIARAHHAGQFVIVIPVEGGERIPLTIADSDAKAGTISLVFQEVGASTMHARPAREGAEDPARRRPARQADAHREVRRRRGLRRRRHRHRADPPDRQGDEGRGQPRDLDPRRAHEEPADLRGPDEGREQRDPRSPPTTAPTARRASSPTSSRGSSRAARRSAARS